MVTKTPEELTKTITMQREGILKSQQYISNMTLKVNSLNDSIMIMNQRCNEKAMERENYYTKKLIEQQKYVNDMVDQIKYLLEKNNNYPILKMEKSIVSDTVNVSIEPVNSNTPDVNNTIIKKLNKIKNKVNN